MLAIKFCTFGSYWLSKRRVMTNIRGWSCHWGQSYGADQKLAIAVTTKNYTTDLRTQRKVKYRPSFAIPQI